MKGQIGVITTVIVTQVLILLIIFSVVIAPDLHDVEAELTAQTAEYEGDAEAAMMANTLQKSEIVNLRDEIYFWEMAEAEGVEEFERSEIEDRIEENVEDFLNDHYQEYHFEITDPDEGAELDVEVSEGVPDRGTHRFYIAGVGENHLAILRIGTRV